MRDPRGGKMFEAIVLAVLKPLVSKLTEDFLNRRRSTVTIAELQDQVIRLMVSHRELEGQVTEARMSVIALTRYLALTQGGIFILNGDRLELATVPLDQRQVLVGHAIEDFNSTVEARLQRQFKRAERTTRQSRSPLPRSSGLAPTHGSVGAAVNSSEALNSFFDNFEEEIMRTRLGREEPSG
jgi:hypothetical protein